MAVNVQVLDEKGLPVFCTVAAVRTSDQTILNLYDTDSEGVARIVEAGTWYPRPMVSLNYKSRIKMIILNDQDSMNADYVVDAAGGGTHLTLYGSTGALAAAIATGVSKMIWVCASHTELRGTGDGMYAFPNLSTGQKISVVSGGRGRAQFTHNHSSPAIGISGGTGSMLRFERLRIIRTGGFSGSFLQGSGGVALPQVEFVGIDWGDDSTSWTAMLDMTGSGSATSGGLLVEDCIGNVNSYAKLSTQAAATGPCRIRGNRLIMVNGFVRAASTDFEVGNSYSIDYNVCSYTSYLIQRTYNFPLSIRDNTFTHTGADDFIDIGTGGTTNITDVTIGDNNYEATAAGARFADLSPAAGTGSNISIMGNALNGPGSGTAINVGVTLADSVILNSYRDWATNVGGIGAPGTGGDHGALSGLSDDDHTQYVRLLGRSGGQTIRGGTDSLDDLFLRSNSFSTPGNGDIFFEDTSFGVNISSGNPRIFFEGASSRLAFDRTANNFVFVAANVSALHIHATGVEVAGYQRVGALTTPTNVTPGDLTAVRYFVNDDSNFSLQMVSGNPRMLLESGTYLQWDRSADDLHFVTLGSLAWSQAWSGGALGDQAMTWRKHGQSAEQQLWQFDLVPQTNQSANFRIGRTTDVGTGTFSFEVFKGNNSTSAAFSVAITNAGTPQVRSFGDMLIDNFLEMTEISAPSTPAANKLRVYVKDKAGVSALYFKKDDGTEVEVGSGGGGGNTEIRLDAQELYPAVTDGCEMPAPVPFSTNNKRFVGARFVVTGTRYAEGEVILPADYAGGTITAKIMWWALTAGSGGADTVRWTVALSAHGDDDALDSAWGTGVSVDDALDGSFTANEMRISAATAAITPSGTPAAGEKLKVRIYREPTHANDTYAGTAVLAGIILDY